MIIKILLYIILSSFFYVCVLTNKINGFYFLFTIICYTAISYTMFVYNYNTDIIKV